MSTSTRKQDAHLVEIGHGKVGVAAAKPSTGFTNGDFLLLKIGVGCQRGVRGEEVSEGGGEERVFIVVESGNVEI
jgi:hypothetical protein